MILFEREGWSQKLDEALDARDASDFGAAIRLATTNLIEGRDKLRNARLVGDELNVRVFSHWLATDAANLVLFLSRRYMTTTRMFFRQAFECPDRPPEFRRGVEMLLGAVLAGMVDIAETAERLTVALLAMVVARGIVVESAEMIV